MVELCVGVGACCVVSIHLIKLVKFRAHGLERMQEPSVSACISSQFTHPSYIKLKKRFSIFWHVMVSTDIVQ